MFRPETSDYEVARSAAADSACLGSDSTAKALVHRLHRTPLRGGWDRPCSLPVEGCQYVVVQYLSTVLTKYLMVLEYSTTVRAAGPASSRAPPHTCEPGNSDTWKNFLTRKFGMFFSFLP